MTELKWDAPGPGGWKWDSAHVAGPTSPALQELLPPSMAAGFQVCTAAYGLPISHIQIRYVNGYAYGAPQFADLSAREVPPPIAAEQALAQKRWREELRWWTEEERPALLTRQRELQTVDLDAIDDSTLADHVDAVADEFRHGMRTHFTLVGATAIPVGDFLAHCARWGLPMEECLALLVGEHPLTVACAPVRAAIGDTRPTSFDEVRAVSADAAAALDELLATVGVWGIGRYDVTSRTLADEPAAVVAAILADPPTRPSAELLRSKVPDDERATFDELLTEAQFTFSARDDHAMVGGIGTIGIIQAAMKAAGRRLGLGDLAFHVSLSELAGALRDGTSLDALAQERAKLHAEAACATPPRMLGEGGGPPPMFDIPGPLGRVVTALFTYMGAMDSGAPMGIGTAVARGRAVVAFEPEDAIDRIEPGDILVTTTTTPAFGAVLPMLGGVVTTSGGALSHAAIVARELGIPAVVGLSDALARIADGVTIEIDPTTAAVRIV
jgi:pyruvate,water dikinase